MKRYIKQIIPVFVMLLFAGIPVVSKSQTVVFYFIAPRSVIAANFASTMDSQYCPVGYAKAQVTSANAARFRSVAPPRIQYVYTQLQTGTALRTNINKVFRNSGGRVVRMEYWLADDRNGFTGGAADSNSIFLQYDDGGQKYVWPAASNWAYPGGRTFAGWAMFGEHQLDADQAQRTGGVNAVNEVVLHETSHTQWTGEWTKWGGVNGHAITYGADGMHYFSIAELIGDQEGAINEGLATYYGYVMNDSARQELMDELNNDGYRYFVEARSVLAGTRDLYTVADRRQNTLTGATYEDGSPVTIFTYKWKSVPGFYLMFAESTSTAFFSIFHNYACTNRDTAFSMIGGTALAMSPDRRKRFLTYACNRLAIRMEAYNASAAGRRDANKVSSIFPFAVLDLLTHFGMTDAEYQADYRRNYADRDPRAYAEYFVRRAALKTLVQADIDASPIRFMDALNKVITYCRQPANMF